MADIPEVVGYLTVKARVIAAIADSIDAGGRPDATYANCKVTFSASVPAARPYVVADDEDRTIVQLRTVTAMLKDGSLYAPADGIKPADVEGLQPVEGINLVAPDQDHIDLTGWKWTATFENLPGETYWRSFSIPFGGAPGETVNLGAAALAQAVSVLSLMPTVWSVAGTTVPAGAKPGQYLLDTTTANLYRIGA